jgi:hypothetical protein
MAAYRAFDARLKEAASRAPFMKGKERLVGVEFGEMAESLLSPAKLDGRVLEISELRDRLQAITDSGSEEFSALKNQKDIDRALPRLVAAVSLMEAFGYTRLELTERELGAGLIIEAGLKTASPTAK